MRRVLTVLSITISTATFCFGADDMSDQYYQAIRNDDLVTLRTMVAPGSSIAVKDRRGTTPLMYAAAFGSIEAMRVLIGKGADVNGRNAFDATPLMWALYDSNKVRLLLSKGADVNPHTKQGRTPLMIAALYPGNVQTVKMLLDRGATVDARDQQQDTALILAADGEIARILVENGADVNAKDAFGFTPLMTAAGGGNIVGDTAWVKLLLSKGADVKTVTMAETGPRVKNGAIALGSFTALHLAAAYGPLELVKILVDAGADVNAREVRGMTPLMLALGCDHNDPRIVRLLLDRGADPVIKSNAGEDSRVWAKKFGVSDIPGATQDIAKKETTVVIQADDRKMDATSAVQKSVSLLQKTSSQFLVEGGCVSCHAQNAASLAVAAVRGKGIHIDEASVSGDAKATAFGWSGFEQPMLQRLDPPGGADTIMFSLLAMNAYKHAPDRTTDAMVFNIAAQQLPTGNWANSGVARPPIQDGPFSRTVLSMRALQLYGIPGRKTEFEGRIARAAAWLRNAQPRTTEDANMKTLGLLWTGADRPLLSAAIESVKSLQRADGGWAQTRYLASDAYAAGQSLYTLHEAGIPVADPAYRRGLEWLLKTQLPDGSWHVASRAPKFQPYFQSGFPHDHDQWISSMATGWAVMALSPAIGNKDIAARAH